MNSLDGGSPPPAHRRRSFRLTRRVFWDLAVYMIGLGLAVGLVFPPFATGLGVPASYATRPSFQVACLVAGFLVGALSYALCRCVVGGRLAELGAHLRRVTETVNHASRTGDWTGATADRIEADSDDQLGETARAFNNLLDALEAGEHFRSLVRNASDVITVVDPGGRITYQTPSVGWVLGYPPAALLGCDVRELLHPEDLATFDAHLAGTTGGIDRAASVRSRMRHRNGTWRWVETVTNDLLADPAVNGIVLTTRDVSDRKELEDRLRTQAFHDPLTGLPNRALFMDRLRAAEDAMTRHGTPSAVLFIDLDNLKTVNDNLGHDCGDTLLQVVASRIRGCLRPDDTLARLAGDEFAILVAGPRSGAHAAAVAERILAVLRQPVTLGDHVVHAGLSLGLATSETSAASGIGLLRAADVAMYVAKTTGKGRCEVFQPSHHSAQLERERLLADLHQAVESGQLLLHYQPIVDLASGEVAGCEALLRWRHPDRGLVPPLHFITLAEESGLIVPIGRWVLRAATEQAAAWVAAGQDRHVTVNVSVRQFQHPDLLDDIREALDRSGLDPQRLVLEITESLFAHDTARTTEKLREVKQLGVRLALDDFGTGYSSLSYLRRFPIDVLKIDKSFVDGIVENAENRAVTGAIVRLGHDLSLTLVAEGIETAAELDAVRALGVHHGQGFHLGRPAAVEDLAGASPATPERRDPASVGAPLRVPAALVAGPAAAAASPPAGTAVTGAGGPA